VRTMHASVVMFRAFDAAEHILGLRALASSGCLGGVQAGVQAAPGDQFVVRAQFDQVAM
jgi:hypothetical protein